MLKHITFFVKLKLTQGIIKLAIGYLPLKADLRYDFHCFVEAAYIVGTAYNTAFHIAFQVKTVPKLCTDQ